MKERLLAAQVTSRLDSVPAVVLLGSRQVGKTTLARAIAEERGGIYLDLESPTDRAKLADSETYLNDHMGSLLVLDEIHRVPDLFPILRGRIDEGRRRGVRRHRSNFLTIRLNHWPGA
jgi:predicted AAA+ superfamily ATPase